MTDQEDRLAGYGCFRDVLRALEREADDWTPDAAWESPRACQATRSTALVTRSERLPEMDDLWAVDEDDGTAGWRERIKHWSPATLMAMAVPIMGLLFFASLHITPTGTDRDWAVVSKVRLEDAHGDSARPVEVAEPRDRVQAFAMLGRQALTAGAGDLYRAVVPYGLSAEPMVTAGPGDTVALPFAITGSEQVPEGATLIIRGVPEYAALSSAEPQADGSWAVPIDRLSEVKLTAYALPAEQSQELVGELRSPGGGLLARATTKLTLAQEPSIAPAVATAPSSPTEPRPKAIGSGWQATVTVPLPGTQILTIQDSMQADAAGKQSPPRGAPEWMQPWNRSALGGAY